MVNNGSLPLLTQNCVIISMMCQNDTDLNAFLPSVPNRHENSPVLHLQAAIRFMLIRY